MGFWVEVKVVVIFWVCRVGFCGVEEFLVFLLIDRFIECTFWVGVL